MRYIAIFLLLANIGYFGWNYYRPLSGSVPETGQARPLLNTGLMLASEYRQLSEAAAEFSCSLVGNFSSVDEANSFIALVETESVSASLSLSGEPLPPQYLVYLSPLSSRAIATITLDGLSESLAAANMEIENYLITRGSLENAIALGVFADSDSATDVRNQVARLGYRVEIEEIPRSSGDIRVQLQAASPDQIENLRWPELTAGRPDLTRVENLCETIAQGTQFP